QARAWKVGDAVDAGRVGELAAALGLAGRPNEEQDGWTVRDGRRALVVHRLAGVPWTYGTDILGACSSRSGGAHQAGGGGRGAGAPPPAPPGPGPRRSGPPATWPPGPGWTWTGPRSGSPTATPIGSSPSTRRWAARPPRGSPGGSASAPRA